jgi:hypothetical protein
MTCKLCGVALLIGALGLGAFGMYHTGFCPMSGCGSSKTTVDPKVSPGDNTNGSDANLVKKEGGCPKSCGEKSDANLVKKEEGGCPKSCCGQSDSKLVKKEGGCCGQPKEKSDGFFTSLAGKASKDEGCCEGKCSEGKDCCEGKGSAKPETPVKK